jgi:hypothetical protein
MLFYIMQIPENQNTDEPGTGRMENALMTLMQSELGDVIRQKVEQILEEDERKRIINTKPSSN